MAIQVYLTVQLHMIGDGVSTSATLVLDSTPLLINPGIINFRPTPDSATLIQIIDAAGNAVPATVTLSKNGKQVLMVFSSPWTGLLTVYINLGYFV